MAEHHWAVLGEADDGVARALGHAGGADAVGAREVVDEERARGLFADQGVYAGQIATVTGEGAAIAVATDQQAALELTAVELELAHLFAATAGLGRAEAKHAAGLRAGVDVQASVATVLARLVAADVGDAGLGRGAHRQPHAGARGVETGELLERILVFALEQLDADRAAGSDEDHRPAEADQAVTLEREPGHALAVRQQHTGTAAEVVAAVTDGTVAGPRGEQHVAKAHPVVVRDRQGASVVSADDQRARQVPRATKHALRDGEALAIGGDDERVTVFDAGNQRLQHRSRTREACSELLCWTRGVSRPLRALTGVAAMVRAVVRLERHRPAD